MLSVIIPNANKQDVEQMVKSVELLSPATQIIVCNDRYHKGKGWAIREGIKEAKGAYICFIDADMDISAGEIHKLLPYLVYYDVVIGVKDIRKLPPRRAMVSLGYRLLVRFLFRLNISDTQTGLKIWKRDTMPSFETDGFAYDIELLVKARKANLHIKEVPINCRIYSAVKLSSIVKTFKETIRIWLQNR